MRTLLAGVRAVRRAPSALAPLALEGAIGAVLIATGAFPANGGSVTATASFPLDIYFDVKQSLAYSAGWAWFVAAIGLGILVRAGALASTMWLSDGRPGPFAVAWWRAAKLALAAAVALFPAAALFFIGVATRYAPFVWIAAVLGLIPAIVFARRGVRLDVGGGEPPGRGVPEAPGWLAYAYLAAAFGAAMTVLGRTSPWLAAGLVLLIGPLHALFLLGWREHLRNETYPGGGTVAVVATVVIVGALFGFTLYDRMVRSAAPTAEAQAGGTLLLLGGVDSTSSTGALAGLDPRELGFKDSRSEIVSYRGAGQPYGIADTHTDLDDVAERVAGQIEAAPPPRFLVGHSQAGLILDRLLDRGLTAPDRAVSLAATPPYPPPLEAPPPHVDAPGRPGTDVARAFSAILDAVGLTGFPVDVPNYPPHLERVTVARSETPRMLIWALADSVWLEGDWRRPGEVNVVALTDHVGVANNTRAIRVTRGFLMGRQIEDDSASWRGFAVALLSHGFAPWRPSS
ncbi:MAG TPA: hypothetical protein VIG64_05535 [Actinomycetota bacterium]|jgi:hypothetical protein